MAAGGGFEPPITDPESAVIPLHHPATSPKIMPSSRTVVKPTKLIYAALFMKVEGMSFQEI